MTSSRVKDCLGLLLQSRSLPLRCPLSNQYTNCSKPNGPWINQELQSLLHCIFLTLCWKQDSYMIVKKFHPAIRIEQRNADVQNVSKWKPGSCYFCLANATQQSGDRDYFRDPSCRGVKQASEHRLDLYHHVSTESDLAFRELTSRQSSSLPCACC